MRAASVTWEEWNARKSALHLEINHAVKDQRIKRATGIFLHAVLRMPEVVDEGARHTRADLATLLGKSVSSIRNYVRESIGAGLLIVQGWGHFVFPALDKPRAEEPLFCAPKETTDCLKSVNFETPPPLEGNVKIAQEAGRPKASIHFDPIETPDTPAVQLLRSLDVQDVGPLRDVTVAQVEEAVAELNGRGRDWGPGLLRHVLLYDLWRNWRRRGKQPKRETTVEDYHTDPGPIGACSVCGAFLYATFDHVCRGAA